MWEYIIERVKREARYLIETQCTVRSCAKALGTSKSTVHKDVTERLKLIDPKLYRQVRKILKKNLSERHIRGGNATREKYARSKRKV
ncbi:MAG: sporulation transcriptional regulator SpoIIID [Clostridia bacterium]|nr:sporulation transcriptional regulator SpoIIID [Clostridia bacterium]